MSDINSPVVRLVAPTELPVHIPDWPEAVGIAICRAGGRVSSLQPYHLNETPMALKRRLIEAAGDAMRGFAIHPPMQGMQTATLSPAEDLQMMSELEQALRSIPRFVEEVADFAINFEFAAEEGLSLDGLNEQGRRNNEEAHAKLADQLPVGYRTFVQADPQSEVISGAMLRPIGAQGVDLLLVDEKRIGSRELPPEATVLVRDDSLRIAIPLGPLLKGGRLPNAIRLPAGSLLPAQGDGKPVPAMVLRRGNFLFVAPDYGAVGRPAITAAPVARSMNKLPLLIIGIVLAVLVVIAAVVAGVWFLMPGESASSAPLAPVDGLRENLFAPRSE